MSRDWLLPILFAIAATAAMMPARAAERQDCAAAEIVLWGDGRHDDTEALNAWFQGKDAIWGEDGAPVGAAIVGRSFRLSAAVYVPSGTGRTLADFRMVWPERGETVSGGTLRSGSDPDRAPVASEVRISGGDPGEGKPYEAPTPLPVSRDAAASCATS
jgi:hypothetical protein